MHGEHMGTFVDNSGTDGGQTDKATILGLSLAANFALHSLPGHVSARTPEHLHELERERERTDDEHAFPWGG